MSEVELVSLSRIHLVRKVLAELRFLFFFCLPPEKENSTYSTFRQDHTLESNICTMGLFL